MQSASTPTNLEYLLVLGVSWLLVGLILTIHFVHYPSFRYAGGDWAAAHAYHTSAIGPLVGPIMVFELGLATWLAYRSGGSWVWVVPLVLVLLTWVNTFFQAVPLHNQLGAGYNQTVIERLIKANRLRTGLWVAKAMWVSWAFLRS